MAAPSTISAAGYFTAARAGASQGSAVIFMPSATKGTMLLAGATINVTADATAKTLKGKIGSQSFTLKIKSRSLLSGTIASDTFELTRQVTRPITAAELAEFDAGPNVVMQAIFNATPDYVAATGETSVFWHHFGNLFYRGRLDGSARVMCIASDPGPAECLPFVRRSLIGDSGQKTQGFLTKLGLTRSYVLVNAFSVAMHPSAKAKGLAILQNNHPIMQARHAMYNALLAGGNLQAIVAFGEVAHKAVDIWQQANPVVQGIERFDLAHPAAVDRDSSGNDAALKGWAKAITQIRAVVTPDTNGNNTLPNYGNYITETDYVRIPRRDLPKVAPSYVGDDAWGRFATPRHNNCCNRPSPDDRESLILTPPAGQGQWLRYHYQNGHLIGAKSKNGKNVAVDQFGLEV